MAYRKATVGGIEVTVHHLALLRLLPLTTAELHEHNFTRGTAKGLELRGLAESKFDHDPKLATFATYHRTPQGDRVLLAADKRGIK